MHKNYTFIVVGGGIAGVSCVESLLTWLPEESVLLLSETQTIKAAKNAIQIAKTMVKFDVEEESTEDFSRRHPGLEILIERAVAVNSEAHTLTTSTGKAFGYRKLCLCLGGKPNLIVDNPYVVGIRDTDSVARLGERISHARRIVICGNGGIASELVYEVQNVEKVWVIKDQHISSVFLDAGAAQFVRGCLDKKETEEQPTATSRQRYTGKASSAALGPDWLHQRQLQGASGENKLTIEFGSSVVGVVTNPSGTDYPVHVVLDSGKTIHADLVVSATGVVPSGDAVQCSPHQLQLAGDGGILVDELLTTSAPDVYAAGDVVTAGWQSAPHWLQMRLWTQARQMGIFAGRAITATLRNEPLLQDFCFEMFSHVTKFFGLKVILMGLFNAQKLDGDCDYLVRITPGNEYVKLVMQNGRVQGAVLIGETDLEEMCENLILDQLDVSFLGEQLLDPDVDIDDYFD